VFAKHNRELSISPLCPSSHSTFLIGRCLCQQAQRDFFGGHTYERIDREGWHHCAWTDSHKDIGDASKRTMGELSHS
jgi:hypothetical protein